MTYSEAGKHCATIVVVEHQLKAMGDFTTAGGARAQGAGGVHPASWGCQRGGGRAGGRLKPDVKVAIGGDRPPRLGGDVVTSKMCADFLLLARSMKQQMRVANQDGGDRAFARRRELVDSATQMMVADEFYDGKTWMDLSEQQLKKGLQKVASVDVTSAVDFCRQIFRVLKVDASVPVDSRVFMPKRALRK